jgi:hypothetical protein
MRIKIIVGRFGFACARLAPGPMLYRGGDKTSDDSSIGPPLPPYLFGVGPAPPVFHGGEPHLAGASQPIDYEFTIKYLSGQ